MKALVWLTTTAARIPGSGRGACPDAPHQRPAVRFVAENPSAVQLLGAEPKTRKEGGRKREGKGKQKLQNCIFWRLDLFQVALGEASFDRISMPLKPRQFKDA